MSELFTEIVFVRHGETDGNCGALLQGRGNGHLSGTGDFEVPGGESKSEFQHRVSRFLDDLVSRHKGGCILLVSHGWTAGLLHTCTVLRPQACGFLSPPIRESAVSVILRTEAGRCFAGTAPDT